MATKRKKDSVVITTYGTDGAAAAAMVLQMDNAARIVITSSSRLIGTLRELRESCGKGTTVAICGVGVGDGPEATLDALTRLCLTGADVTWYCGRGYLAEYEAEISKRCFAAMDDYASNTEAVFRHTKPAKSKQTALLLELAAEYAGKKKPASEEHAWWHDYVQASAARYFHFGDESAYPECIRRMAGLDPVTSTEKGMAEQWRHLSGKTLPVGNSAAMKRLRTMIGRIGPIGEPVLVLGPSGSGKEMVARLIHERSKLEKRRNELLAKKKTHEESAAVLAGLNRQRHDLLDRLDKLRQERFDIRKGIADRITEQVGPTVVVEVMQCGNVDAYQDLLESSLKSAAVQHKQVAAKLAGRVTPSDFTDAIRRGDADILVDRGEVNRDQARKVIDALAGTPALYDFETVEMGDQPSIRLRDGDEYKDSLSLSTSQKCTCILPILLLESDKPLLVDQPEDNLDNRFVFDTVVKRIREVKQSRQLIFITHNPNIPVLGMAERVFVLSSNGSHAEVQHSGPVDECRDQIVTLLEGGQEAFMERKNRYGF